MELCTVQALNSMCVCLQRQAIKARRARRESGGGEFFATERQAPYLPLQCSAAVGCQLVLAQQRHGQPHLWEGDSRAK